MNCISNNETIFQHISMGSGQIPNNSISSNSINSNQNSSSLGNSLEHSEEFYYFKKKFNQNYIPVPESVIKSVILNVNKLNLEQNLKKIIISNEIIKRIFEDEFSKIKQDELKHFLQLFNKISFTNIDEIEQKTYIKEKPRDKYIMTNYKKSEPFQKDFYEDEEDQEIYSDINLNEDIRTRIPYKNKYWNIYPYPCLKNEKCNRQFCFLSHNDLDRQYHPFNYKTSICDYLEKCTNKKFCPNAHSFDDIRNLSVIYDFEDEEVKIQISIPDNIIIPKPKIKLITSKEVYNKYKREKCKIHDKETIDLKCIYFHNDLDERRDPKIIKNAMPCWNRLKENKYSEPCLRINCPFAHNDLEILFDLKNFRKIKCPEQNLCEFGEECCPYIHNKKIN